MNGLAVFFDMDGVLCDFVRGALMFHGREDMPYCDVRWGIEAQLGLSPTDFWKDLSFGFWSALPAYADGMSLLAAAERLVGADRIALLTSPCDTAGCCDGKREWVAKHLPAYRRRLFMGSAKELFAGPTKVLVDDHDANVKAFSAAGGRTVQPPRPWNTMDWHCTGPDGTFDVDRTFAALAQEIRFAQARAA
jgi:hypothetical protein